MNNLVIVVLEMWFIILNLLFFLGLIIGNEFIFLLIIWFVV